MKLRLSILLLAAALAASPAAGQTIKSLGYNTTNGQVVYSGTNPLTFTNPLAFGDTTNTASIRTNLGLGATNYPVFRGLEITDGDTLYINPYNINADTFGLVLNFEERNFAQDGATVFEWSTNSFTVTPNATLNGVNNTAPSQTADSGSSLMTRSLSDARYPIYETIYPNNNQTAADTGNFYGPVITIPLNWVPSSIQIHAELEFTSSPVAAGPTNFRFRTSIRDVEGASMNSSLNTSIVNATSVTNVSGDRYIIKGEITTFPASWSTRLASHETIFLVLDATVFNETGGSLTLVNNQSHRVGYRIFR